MFYYCVFIFVKKKGVIMATVKEEAKQMIDDLPEKATWEDIMYALYVKEAVEAGLEDSKAGKVTEVYELRREFGLSD